jgi:hypothetical protein
MRFAWNRATADDPIVEPSHSEDAPLGELGAVELLLTDAERRVAWIDTGGQRTSDWLNAHPEVPVLGLATPEAAASDPPDAATSQHGSVERERIVWVVPPPLPPNRHLRLHRRRVLVHFELEDHEVSGQVHVRPGADAIDQVMRGTRDLVPLTDVQVMSRDEPGEGMALPVLIVNRRHVRRVVEDTPHVSAPVPDPVAPMQAGDAVDPRLAWLGSVASPTPGEPPASAAPAEPADVTQDRPETAEPSGVELLHAALALLLETGVIDVVEFQSIRARIPAPPKP